MYRSRLTGDVFGAAVSNMADRLASIHGTEQDRLEMISVCAFLCMLWGGGDNKALGALVSQFRKLSRGDY